MTSNFFRCTMYMCHTLYSVIVLSNNTQERTKKKDSQMSVYQKADIGELIQWVTHESWSSAASNSGSIRIGTQPRTADAWHQWLMPAARRRHLRFFGHFWPSVWPSSRSNFDLGPSPLDSTEKIFYIRAYDFGVQFSFKHGWVNTRAEKTRWCNHGLKHGWDYRRVVLPTGLNDNQARDLTVWSPPTWLGIARSCFAHATF